MNPVFREYLKKVGSGSHTHKDLTRAESADAMTAILTETATPAQIGAFLIAHRIKRPTAAELAGILDAFDVLAPKLSPISSARRVAVMGNPYDGRTRTVPVSPITALILAAAGVPVIQHGGDRMPTKYGLPLIEIWQALGIAFHRLSLAQNCELLQQSGLAFVYLPRHFPQALSLVAYREQLGKRPPVATAELIWSPYIGATHIVAGYVHPPTEERFQETLALRGHQQLTAIKGLEGSCDLPMSRTAIIGRGTGDLVKGWKRILVHPTDYDLVPRDLPLTGTSQAIAAIQSAIVGQASPLRDAAILNGGFYLWDCGVVSDLVSGLSLAEKLLERGQVAQKLADIHSRVMALV